MTKADALNILQHFPLPVQAMILYALTEFLEKMEAQAGANRLLVRDSSGYATQVLFEYLRGAAPAYRICVTHALRSETIWKKSIPISCPVFPKMCFPA